MSGVKTAVQAAQGGDNSKPGEVVSEVSDGENGQVSENPRKRLRQNGDHPSALGDREKMVRRWKMELLADMNVNMKFK